MRKPTHIVATYVVVTLCLWSMAAPIFGQSTWAGGAGSWGTASNWCPAGVPNGVDVIVGNCQNANPSTVTVDASNTSNNLTIAGGNTVSISPSKRLTVNGASISNAGTLALSGSGANGAQLVLAAPTATLSGGGTLLLSDAPNIVFSGTSTNFINQQTIRGAGGIGTAGGMNLKNQGLFDAQGTNPMTLHPTLGMTNTGTLQASSGGILQLQVAGSGTDNTGGTIRALTGSTVLLQQGTITGGTLTTVGSGLIRAQSAGINSLTNSGTFQVGGVQGLGSASVRFSGTLNNSGTIRLGSPAWGDDATIIDGTVTLTGGGTFTFDNSVERLVSGSGTPNLVNSNNTINGTGTMLGNPLSFTNAGAVDANRPTPLIISAATTNTGTLQASNGGDLRLTQATVNNTGGTLKALDGSTVTLAGGTITGGTFTSSGSGVVQVTSNNPTVDSVSNTGMFLFPDNGQAVMLNTIANSGVISLNSTGVGPVTFRIGNAVTFTGHGAIMMSDSTFNGMFSQNGGSKITNFDNLIAGAGQIGAPLVNQKKGVVLANLTNILKLNSSVNNQGKLQVNPGSLMQIPGTNNLTNFTNNTLTGGTFVVGGTFAFAGANIITNAANIQLTSPTWQLINILNNAPALPNLATNTKKGQLTVTGKAALTTIPSFTTQGKVTVGAKSNFTVGGSYTQTLGSTKVDGTLTIPTGYFLQGGGLFGKGKVVAVVTSGGAVTAGDTANAAGKLTIDGTYTQQNAASLNIQIGGTTVGKYSQLAVTNGVSLDGTLNLTLIKNFLPAIGDTFTILTASARSGQFATVNGLSINSGEHFQITYTANSVQLQVVSGP